MRIALSSLLQEKVSFVQRHVCLHYGVSLEEMIGVTPKTKKRSRLQHLVWPRRVAVYIARNTIKVGGMALPFSAIGGAFDMDHSAAIHHCKVCEDLIHLPTPTYVEMRKEVEKIKEEVAQMLPRIEEQLLLELETK